MGDRRAARSTRMIITACIIAIAAGSAHATASGTGIAVVARHQTAAGTNRCAIIYFLAIHRAFAGIGIDTVNSLDTAVRARRTHFGLILGVIVTILKRIAFT